MIIGLIIFFFFLEGGGFGLNIFLGVWFGLNNFLVTCGLALKRAVGVSPEKGCLFAVDYCSVC